MNSSPVPGPVPGPPHVADPQQIHADVDALLERVDRVGGSAVGEGTSTGAEDSVLGQMAQLLEQAHDVLVAGLSTVDRA